jgi:toxin ParE1/3/4
VKKLRIAGPAETDLDEIWDFVAKQSASEEIANRFIDNIVGRISSLSHSPKIGVARDWIEPGLRALPVGKYIIYYRELARAVLIVRIIHGNREQGIAYESSR